ncbi:MAG TPA: YdiU family protein [Albitalea sp.]|nr:YdiU family protein [Albitalea sp.]
MSDTLPRPLFRFDNSYARELAGLAVPWQPAKVPSPSLLYFNRALADELGIDADALDGERGAAVFSGNELPDGAAPIAQAYAGHQFGGFSPSLGDGRALLLGEVIDRFGRRRDIAFKGSGRTPFSRGGDGKAAVGPVLREAIIGEAMHALGIPTTRALAATATGEPVFREDTLAGAVLTRVASSHLRVGTFQYFAARGQLDELRRLADYAIRRHDGALADHPDRHVELLRAVAERQAELVARWMHVGFIHGVMNTDNMTISGETIDFGPCAFMEAHDPGAVFSSIDTHGRYAYANQPLIARWNLARLAEALLPLVDVDQQERALQAATEVIDAFPSQYERHWLAGARAKLGLARSEDADATLAHDWLALLQSQRVDHTLAWRYLADAADGEGLRLQALFEDARPLAAWLARWRDRAAREDTLPAPRAQAMRRTNPIYIARNHRVEEALAAASADGDLAPFRRLLEVLAQPFDERAGLEDYAAPAPAEVTAGYRTFCGT